jgi:NADH-quinone oxidoreductase subunit L
VTAVLWVLVAVPLVTGLALLCGGRNADRVAGPAALAAATVTLAAAITQAVGRSTVRMALLAGVPARLTVDGLATVLVLVITTVTLAVLVYATAEFRTARFFGLMLLFAGAMLVTVTAANLLTLLAGWEIMGATSYALIGYWWPDPGRVRSANLAFLTTRAADLGLYLAAGAALAGGVTDLSLARLPEGTGPWLHVATAGLVVAALGKSAQLPFSFWLSKAMAGPSPVSALLHSATMVAAGAYLLLRLDPLLEAASWAGPAVAWVGVSTALLLAAVAVTQTDLKQLLAASTCSQIGFIVLAAGSGGQDAGALQLAAHAAAKSLLLLVAGAWLTALGTKDLTELVGAARRYPLVGILFTIGALTLAGVPPLSIWVAKDEVLSAALHESPALYAVGLAASVLSAVYAAKALALVWRPQSAGAGGRINSLMQAPLLPLAVAAAVLGLFAQRLEPWQLAVSGTLALLTVAAVVAARPIRWAPRMLAGWLGMETVAVRGVARPVMTTSRALSTFDDRVMDGMVRAVAAFATATARLTNLRVEVSVDGAARALAGGARRLGALARRPQTGQVHQYYAQAAVAFALLALVLVVVSSWSW